MKEQVKTFINKAPLFPVTVAFICGILSGVTIDSLWILSISAVIACLLILFKKYIYSAWIIAFGLGAFNISGVIPPDDISIFTESELYYRARIISVMHNDNSQSAIAEICEIGIDSLNVNPCHRIRVRITTPSYEKELSAGYGIDFYAKFQRPKSILDLPDEFDITNFLKRRFIDLTALVEPDRISKIYPADDIISNAKRFRTEITTLLYRTSLSADAKVFLNATILGDASDLTPETRSIFSASGLSHVLALSGLHVGIIAFVISLALWPIRIFSGRQIIMAITIIILWFYAMITGFSPSVTRAVIMTSLYLLGLILQRRYTPINSLLAAALIILIFSPDELFSIGFQLSFAAVLSIILFSGRLNPINRKNKIAFAIASYIELSLAAVIGTAMISAYYFHTMPLYFIVGNLAIALFLPIIIGGGLLIIITSAIGFDAVFLCDFVSFLHSIMYTAAQLVSKIPSSTITGIYFPAWIIVIYAVAVISLYLLLSYRSVKYGIVFGIFLITTIVTLLYSPTPHREPKIYIARESFRTNLVIDNCTDTLYVLTTTPEEPISVMQRAEFRYSDYMSKRDIRGIRIIGDSSISRHGFKYSDNYLQFGNVNIAIVSRKEPMPIRDVDYLLICRGFHYYVSDLVSKFNPDTLILSYDLNPKRAKKYNEECILLNQNVINLRDDKFAIDYR